MIFVFVKYFICICKIVFVFVKIVRFSNSSEYNEKSLIWNKYLRIPSDKSVKIFY